MLSGGYGIDGGLAEQDAAEMMARHNILAASRRDARRLREADDPVAVVRWRFQNRSWMRYSELDGTYIVAEMPETLTAHVATLAEVPDGLVLGFVEEQWQVLSDDPESDVDADAPAPSADADALAASADAAAADAAATDAATAGPATAAPATAVPATAAADAPDAPAEASVADQIEAWRRRSRSD